MKHPALCCAVTALLLAGAPSADAQDAYWYAGVGSGYSRVQFYSADFSSGGSILGCSPCTDSKKDFDGGFKGFIGYQINRNWATEVGYVTVGKFHWFYNNGGITQDATYKVTGVGFSMLPTVPFTRNFSLFGRFGAFFSQTRLTFQNFNFVPGASSEGRQVSETSFLSGFGAQYFFGGDNGVRLEFENFGTVGDCSTLPCVGRANAKMASFNLIFKF